MRLADLEAVVAGAAVRSLFALPEPALRLLGGARPAVARDLEPDAWLLARAATLGRGRRPGDASPAEARERFERECRIAAPRPRVPVEATERTIPGPAGVLPARLYVPRDAGRPGPLLVFLHGGGFVVGSLDSHDATCRLLAHEAGVRILAVDYRLAPEHPYPAAADDAEAAFRWAAEHAAELGADPRRIAVGGDSAGGNLAAVTARRARDAGGPRPAFQLLVYPATDFSRKHPAETTYGQGFVLTSERMDWFEAQYVPDTARQLEPDASPLLAEDLTGLPPAYVATALADPLRDEGEAYARRLAEAGVPVALHRHPHLHGFLGMTALPSARRAVASVAGALRQGLAGAAG